MHTQMKFAALLLAAIAYTNPAQASVNCNSVENLGNSFSGFITTQINNDVAGSSHRINRRKTLQIHRVQSLSFTGCELSTTARVTLKRKIRRDAHGTVRLTAKVHSMAGGEICLSKVKVKSVNVSRTLRVGEWFYKLVANMVIPNNQCYRLR